ncbi:MAG: HAMP domain-containing histidine kinase [Gammaproteobacteria bacterium]|nr:HAMP domain-containing histidine kinase [Gammaproteobacteria bacterium]
MSFLSEKLLLGNEHRLLGLMIATLIAAISFSDNINISRSLFITHFGFFLMWQPVYKRELDFSLIELVVLLGLIGLFLVWLNVWLIPFWMLLLLSLLTGRIFSRGMGRIAYGVAVIVLFLQLTLITTPELFGLHGFSNAVITTLELVLIFMLVPLLFIRSLEQHHATRVDFIRGFLIVILTTFLCMGSVLVTFTANIPYIQSLASTILIAAIFLLFMALLWSPRRGFSGLAQLWERYLLNIGGPLEQWISQLSSLEANASLEPDYFLNTSISYLQERHWISGIQWKTDTAAGLTGERTKYLVRVSDDKVELVLYAHSPIGPALLLHSKLLLSVLIFYYKAKIQERLLTKQAHLRAIYETGSKLTHDVKNILQSTKALTQAVLQEDGRIDEAHQMLRKQLPLLTDRLQATLDKLSAPALESTESVSLKTWWEDMKAKYAGRNIEFSESIDSETFIPAEVFNTVTENLLENARAKRQLQPDLSITLSLHSDTGKVQLRVVDNGKPVPDETLTQLFSEVIFSENGFGIGLYQSSQIAKRAGYKLLLENNTPGNVCFSLTNN